MPSYEEYRGIPVYRITSLWIPKIRYPIPNFPRLIRVLNKIIKQYDVDLIHFWNIEYLSSIPAMFIKGIPKAISIVGIPGICWFYGNFLIDQIGRVYSVMIGKRITASVSKVIVFGKSIIPHLVRFGIPRERIRVAAYGVDEQKFIINDNKRESIRMEVRDKLGISDDVVVLFVGRLSPVKGITYLLKAAKRLIKIYNNIIFLFAGDGELRKLVADFCKKVPRTIFLGYRGDIPELMCAADILILPSLSEGLPLTLLEAGTIGLPVVATKVGCVPDIIINGKTGILIPAKSVNSLVLAISKLIEDMEFRDYLSKNLRSHVLKNYNWSAIIKQYESIYQELLK